MSIMSSICKPANRPIVATILGDSGMGKTSLAATFPNPIFLRAEDGLQAIPEASRPDALPVIVKAEDVFDQIAALINEPHEYKTLVIDSVTALERLFIQSVIDSDHKKPRSINQALGGYGAGLSAVATMHQRVRKVCGLLNAETETIDLPDSEPYTRYNLRLGKKSIAPYVDDSDLVGFIKLQTFTSGEGERKKAISTGERLMVCYAQASAVGKNRFGITTDVSVKIGVNPLIGLVPSF
jgi:GTPase SAR1 family protein